MKNKKRTNLPIVLLSIAILLVLAAGLMYILQFLGGEEKQVTAETCTFTESSKELRNPNRGFYYIHGFQITDEKQDYRDIVLRDYAEDKDTTLTLVQINLQEYNNGAITEAGLANIEALFSALKEIDKELIVRFLYDLEGKNQEHEPRELGIILKHMEQLKPILSRHSKQIFTLQGLFIGNWGEMNGSKYQSAGDLRKLAKALAHATDDDTFLSVRTPAQWRTITSAQDWQDEKLADREEERMGLYNDGILGNATDYGTYGSKSASDAEAYNFGWHREDELAFQEKLCAKVPNGGEVIQANYLNNLDNARETFGIMHITYLNRDYDTAVLEKWQQETITEEGCFYGMDGLTYMERHLGYRLLITDTAVTHNLPDSHFSVDITMKNVGFGPLYRDAEVVLTLYNEKKEEVLTYEVPQNLRKLSGGSQADEAMTIHKSISLSELSEKKYKIYVSVTDSRTGKPIFLANEQEPDYYGYELATIKIK